MSGDRQLMSSPLDRLVYTSEIDEVIVQVGLRWPSSLRRRVANVGDGTGLDGDPVRALPLEIPTVRENYET